MLYFERYHLLSMLGPAMLYPETSIWLLVAVLALVEIGYLAGSATCLLILALGFDVS